MAQISTLDTLSFASLVRRISLLALLAALVLGAPAAAVTIFVSTLVDEPPAANGNCTLREALAAAQLNTIRDLCPAGQGFITDVIVLPAGILEWNGGEHQESGIGGPVVLRGPATPANTPPTAQIEIDAMTKGRFLRLLSGAGVTLANVEIRHGDVTGESSDQMGGAILALEVTDVDLTLHNVRLDGNVAKRGGALYFETDSGCDPCRLTIERSVIATNLAANDEITAASLGGGALLEIRGETAVRIVDTRFQVNRVSNSRGNPAQGGGLFADLEGTSNLDLRRVVFAGNSAASDTGPSEGGGAQIIAAGHSSLEIVDATFEHNSLDEPTVADGTYRATALHLKTESEASFHVDRMKLLANDPGDVAVDLRVAHFSQIPSQLSNVLVAGGATRGAHVETHPGQLLLGHWTLTDHATEELRLDRGTGELRLENSIVYGLQEVVQSGMPTIDNTNLIGLDPYFEDPASGDYRLSSVSPARDIGNETFLTVARYDLGHGARVLEDTDAGAYEYGAVFSDDFESGTTGVWSATQP